MAPRGFKIEILDIMENISFYTILESSVILDKNLSSTEKILYSLICLFSNNKKGYCFKSNNELMEIMNLKHRQFYYCITSLKKYNYIIIKKVNTRTYIMPVINKIYIEAEQKRQERRKNMFDYDWLNDRE